MSNIRAFDRAQEAFTFTKKRAVRTKTIVFVITKPTLGVDGPEIRFPYPGKVVEVCLSLGQTGTTSTLLQVERCHQSDYTSLPVWDTVLTTPITLAPGAKSIQTPPSTVGTEVTENDYFRLNFIEVGENTGRLVVELVIEI